MSCYMKISRRSFCFVAQCQELSYYVTVSWNEWSSGWECGYIEGDYSKLSLNGQDYLPCVAALPVPNTKSCKALGTSRAASGEAEPLLKTPTCFTGFLAHFSSTWRKNVPDLLKQSDLWVHGKNSSSHTMTGDRVCPVQFAMGKIVSWRQSLSSCLSLPLPRVSSEVCVGEDPFIMAQVCCQNLLLCVAVGICLGVVLF